MRDARPWIIGGGLLLRLAIAPWGAHPGDLPVLTEWAAAWQIHGWQAIYLATSANYPPLGTALIGGMGALYTLLSGGALPDAASPLWSVLVKLPAILADGGIAAAVSARAQRRSLAALAVMANPALILLSAWWGQLESVYALGALLAVLAAVRGRSVRAGMWLALGALVKPQALVIAPLLLTHPRRSFRAAAGFGGIALAAFTPYLIIGQAGFVLRRTIALIAGPGWLTVNAANLWYLATGGAGNWSAGAPLLLPDSTPLLAGLTPRLIGVGLLALWTGAALIRWWLRGDAAFTAVLLVLGVFFLPTQAHERYAFGAVVFALISMRPALALAITVLHTLNLLWAFGLPPGMPLPAAFLLLMISVWIPRGASARLLPRAGRSRPATAQSPTGPQSTRR